MKEHISITLGMELASLKKAMEQAQQLVSRAMANIKKVVVGVAAAIGVALGMRELARGIGEVIDRGKGLDTLARSTGLAAEEIVTLHEALFRSGASARDAAEMMVQLRDRMFLASFGADNLANILTRMGLDVEALQKMSLPDQFVAIASAVNKIGDPMRRAQLSAEIFGESAKEIVAAFQDGDMAEAMRLMGESGHALAGSAAVMAMISDAWGQIKTAGEKFFTGMATKMAPAFNAIITLMKEWLPKFYEVGAKVGEVLVNAFEVAIGLWKTGNFGNMLKLSFQIAVNYLGDGLTRVLKFAGSLAETVFTAAMGVFVSGGARDAFVGMAHGFGMIMLSTAKAWLSAMSDSNYWAGIGSMMVGVGQKLYAAMIYAAEAFVTAVQEGTSTASKLLIESLRFVSPAAYAAAKAAQLMGAGGKKGLPESVLASASKADQAANASFAKGGKLVEAAITAVDWSKLFADGIDKFKKTWDQFKASDAFDGMKGAFAKIPELWKASAGDIFNDPKLRAELMKIFKDAGEAGAEWAKKFGAKPMTQQGGKMGEKGGFQNTLFDSFRRVGGGLAGESSSIQEKSYRKLGEINENIKRLGGKRPEHITPFGGSLNPAY